MTWQRETFRENILIINLLFYLFAGVLVYFTIRRHRTFIMDQVESSYSLTQETDDCKKTDKKGTYFENFDDLTDLGMTQK